MRLIAIAGYPDAIEASLAKARLEEEDIPAYITDSNVVAIDWFLVAPVGGVKLEVAEEHVARASEILAIELEPLEVDPVDCDRCPDCGSYEVGVNEWSKWFRVLVLCLWFVPIPWRALRCKSCDATWNREKPRHHHVPAPDDTATATS